MASGGTGIDTPYCDPVKTRRTGPYRPWQDIAAEKKAEQLARIPREWLIPETLETGVPDLRHLASLSGLLSARELGITGAQYDATALLAEIASGALTATEVVTAFCKRAAVAQQVCNCLTEIMFTDAIAAAERLDEAYSRTGKTIGPLHGLPMSFKECFHVKGYDASDGYISRAFDPSVIDSHLVSIVRNAGAVIIAKTNTPQTMLVPEAHNNLFGRTKNPVVSHLTPGGSSGGEGSLLAFRGSALGIGTDVGGSIRIPAAACGIWGYKPSFGVLPMLGYAASSWTGMNTGIYAVPGPMAQSMRDLSLLARVVRDSKPWLDDPAIIPYVCEMGTPPRLPVVGVVERSGLTPHPPIQRALREAMEKLRRAGLTVKAFEPVDFGEIGRVTRQLFTIDGLSYQKRELSKVGEPPVASVQNIGFWDIPEKTHTETWSWNTKKLAIQKEMLDRWTSAGVDVVLCPAGPHTAVKPDNWTHDMYTVCWNAVDYPAVVIPFTHVDSAVDLRDEAFEPLSEEDAKVQALCKLLM
ncbi:unnamed protein product [Discula destructiva]